MVFRVKRYSAFDLLGLLKWEYFDCKNELEAINLVKSIHCYDIVYGAGVKNPKLQCYKDGQWENVKIK